MKTKQLLLSLLTLGTFSGMLYAGGATESLRNLTASKKVVAEEVAEPEMKIKREYDFTFNTTNTGIPLTCSEESVTINGIKCFESNYEGYDGLLFQANFNFRQGGLCQMNSGGRTWGINNLKSGYKVTIVVGNSSKADGFALIDNSVGTQISGKLPNEILSNDTLVYSIENDGVLAFTVGKWSDVWGRITSVKIEAPVEYKTTYIDFNKWEGDALAIDASKVVGNAFAVGNNDYFDVYQCTTPGLERFAFQAVTDGSGKGYWIRPGKGGLYDYNADRSMAVKDLKAGSKVTMVSTGNIDLRGGGTGDGKWTVEDSIANIYVVTMTEPGNLGMCVSKNIYLNNITIVEEKAGIETPVISAKGAADEINTITITCPTDGAVIYYSISGADPVLYEVPFTVNTTCNIAAYAELSGDKSDVAKFDVVAGYISKPTAAISSVNGINRTVAVASVTEGSVIEVSTDGINFSVYSEPIVISDTTSVWSVAKKNDFISDTLSTSIAAGTAIKLNEPVYAKTSYDEATGISVYSVTSNTSNILCTPDVTIRYTLPDGSEGTCDNGASLEIKSLGKLIAVAEADGYESAQSYIWVKAPSILTQEWKIDFDTLASVKGSVDVILSGSEIVNGSNFQYMSMADSVVPNVMVAEGTKWLNRIVGEIPRGLYQFNSGARNMAVTGLKRNQFVKIHTDNLTAGTAASSMTMIDTGTAVLDATLTDADTLVFRMIAPGALVLNCTRYYYTHAITVYSDPNVTKDVEYSIVKCDGIKRYVEITCATPGSQIYYRTGIPASEIVTDEEGNETVVDKTEFSEYVLYTEPVEIAETTVVGAYGTYQDVDSDEVKQTFDAGTTVVLNTPVIKFTDTEDTSVKLFEITVDNSKVVASPVARIYYTIPGQEAKLYESPVAVSAEIVGWMTASASLGGYDTSLEARRYLDSRSSYTETYLAIDNTTAAMPSYAIGDMEIDYSQDINVSQTEAAKAEGRVYLHRVAKNGVIHVVLPFAMTNAAFEKGDVKVTDGNGRTLTKGTDFKVYKLENSDNPIQSELTGNILANTGYVVKVSDELFNEEIIFVSAPGITFGVNQTTFNQPSSGYSVKVNRRLIPVTLEIPAYILNEEQNVYELVIPDAEAGIFPVIAPYQSCILADKAICADPSKAKIEIDLSLGVNDLQQGIKTVKSLRFFNLSGVEISMPTNGIVIKQTIYTDGTQVTDKINIK